MTHQFYHNLLLHFQLHYINEYMIQLFYITISDKNIFNNFIFKLKKQ